MDDGLGLCGAGDVAVKPSNMLAEVDSHVGLVCWIACLNIITPDLSLYLVSLWLPPATIVRWVRTGANGQQSQEAGLAAQG